MKKIVSIFSIVSVFGICSGFSFDEDNFSEGYFMVNEACPCQNKGNNGNKEKRERNKERRENRKNRLNKGKKGQEPVVSQQEVSQLTAL